MRFHTQHNMWGTQPWDFTKKPSLLGGLFSGLLSSLPLIFHAELQCHPVSDHLATSPPSIGSSVFCGWHDLFRRHRKWVGQDHPIWSQPPGPHSPSRLDQKTPLAEGLILTGSGSCPGALLITVTGDEVKHHSPPGGAWCSMWSVDSDWVYGWAKGWELLPRVQG